MFLELVVMCATTIFIYMNGPGIIKNAVVDRYNRFTKLNKFVSTQYKNRRCKTFCISCELVGKAMYLSFIQWLNNSVTQLDKNTYLVNYVLKNRLYTMVVKPCGGPTPVLLVTDEDGEDVTDRVVPYIGPKNDFHGEKLTPKFFNTIQLNFETSFGDTIIFNEPDILEIC